MLQAAAGHYSRRYIAAIVTEKHLLFYWVPYLRKRLQDFVYMFAELQNKCILVIYHRTTVPFQCHCIIAECILLPYQILFLLQNDILYFEWHVKLEPPHGDVVQLCG